MDHNTIPIIGAVGGCVLLVAGVATVNRMRTASVSQKVVHFSTPDPLGPSTMLQMTDMPPLEEIQPVSATSARSIHSAMTGRTDATSATSVCSMDVGTPYTTLPMGGFHRESMKPMMNIESTPHGGYLVQQEQDLSTIGSTIGKDSEKLIKSLIK
ncbi:hypothetical protein HDU98_000405 [Podochytrium sp. JEL0797]|nr:hypothetical protein HDU98_000405 [Podochytrium sp. JEL0797]